jgi:hypothetical protein
VGFLVPTSALSFAKSNSSYPQCSTASLFPISATAPTFYLSSSFVVFLCLMLNVSFQALTSFKHMHQTHHQTDQAAFIKQER